MPQPLLTFELHDYFLAACFPEIFDSKQEHLTYLKNIIEMLPPINRNTLRKLVQVFLKVWKDSYEESQRLTSEIWGIALLLRKSVHEIDKEVEYACKLIRIFVQDYKVLFDKTSPVKTEGIISITRRINKSKLDQIEKCYAKLKAVGKDLVGFLDNESEVPSSSLKVGFSLLEKKLEAILDICRAKINDIPCIIDTHHLDRFFSYLLDFHTGIIKVCQEKRFARSMSSFKLRGVYEKIYLSMHYELNLFFGSLDTVVSGALKDIKSLRAYTIDMIEGEDAKNFWRLSFGEHSFIGSFSLFTETFTSINQGILDQNTIQWLKLVLDEHNSGFVTAYKFAKFIHLFGPLNSSLKSCVDFVSKPWFQGHISQYEASKLLESYPPCTYLIRFTDQECNSFAVNFKTDAQQLFNIRIDVSNDKGVKRFVVKEGNTLRTFESPVDIVEHYKNFLKYTLSSRLPMKPWFYGDFSLDEASQFLQYEVPGTFMLRFSSLAAKFTVEYINDSGDIIQCRLDRLPNERVRFNTTEYDSLENFLSTYSSWFRIPYTSANQVNATREDELIRTQDQINQLLEDDETSIIESNISKLTRKPSVGQRGSSTLLMNAHRSLSAPFSKSQKEETLTKLLAKSSSSNELELDEESQLVNMLFDLTPDSIDSIQKKVHSKIAAKRQSKSLLKPKGIRFSKYTAFSKEPFVVNKMDFIDLKITNHYKETVIFDVLSPYEINSRFFLAVSPPSGVLEPGKHINLRISIVLYKPLVLREMITICCHSEKENGSIHHTFSIPVMAAPKKECLLDTIHMDAYWIMPCIPEGEILGRGGSGMVKKCNLFGAPVAIKIWDLGKMDDPPFDFCQELDVLLSLRHQNLVSFVGAIGKKGTACIAIEFVAGGSLDRFLEFPSHEEINRRLIEGITTPLSIKWKHNISVKLQMAIDAAQGMLYLHDNNIIHRDVKSLNLLIDPETLRIKVADFGESAVKDSNISESVGSTPWMAPEVYNSKVYSAKADVFSFGLILYEIMTESYPVRLNDMIAEGKIPEIPLSIETEYPDMTSLIKRCCRSNCEKRPTMFNILRDLEGIKAQYQIRKPRRGGFK